MLLFLIAYLAGALTIVSPCILPVLPFVFARAGQPFLKSGLPLLAGMAITFAAVGTLAAIGGGWAVQANLIGRWAALVLLALFGLTLIFPALADRLTRPLVALGGRLTERAAEETHRTGASVGPSFVLGVATGLLWAPCAGPVLGLILTGAALQGASASTTVLLVAYALGAATSLALALLVGGRVFKAMKASLGAGEWIRRGLGVLVLVGVAAIALGLDTGLLTRLSANRVNAVEQGLLSRAGAGSAADSSPVNIAALPVLGAAPGFAGGGEWINSPPLTAESLRGKVVVVDFWTYSCINCLRTLPYVRAWADKYQADGLVVVGVHTPEFAFEKNPANVRDAVRRLGVTYPVVLDNDFAVWRAFDNKYWPAHYFIDAQGRVRHIHFGEGDYAQSEQIIRQLLAEAGHAPGAGMATVAASGVEAPRGQAAAGSPETYVGYSRARGFVSPGGARHDAMKTYAAPTLKLNEWAFSGPWIVRSEQAEVRAAGGRLRYRFQARDLHLVMGAAGDRPVRFRVTLDGHAPGRDAGTDIDASGAGRIDGQRLYQLIRQSNGADEHVFEIEFLDPGAQTFAFTFG